MTFLSPWYLVGLLGIGIPLAIHLIRRERAVRIVFSTLRFLKEIPPKYLRVHRIQHWLLLFVRASIVALLAVAFARPLITGALSNRLGGVPQSVVILLDVSMSMGYGDYFERAKTEAIRILTRLESGDEAAIITFSDGIDTVKPLSTDRDDLVLFVRNLNAPTYQSTRSLPAQRHADALLKRGYPDRSVYVISDFQPHAFGTRPDPTNWRFSPGVRFNGIRIADTETTNLAVTQVTLLDPPIREREAISIAARVQNFGTRAESTARVSLRMDGNDIETKTVNLAEKEAAIVTFSTFLRRQGVHLGDVSVEDRRFDADNTYYFTADLPPPIKVLCVGRTSAPGGHDDRDTWFRTALGIPGTAVFDLTSISLPRFDPARLDDFDVIVLMGGAALDSGQINALRAHTQRGGGLLLVADDSIEPAIFNKRFTDLSPALLAQKQMLPGQAFIVITEVRSKHPIIRSITGEAPGDFSTARFRGYWQATAADSSDWILELENGAPLLLERSLGKGRVLLFASPLDTQWSDLALQVFYLPLVQATVRYLARGEAEKNLFAVGESVPIRAEAGDTVQMTGPRGREAGTVLRSDPPFYYRKTLFPGVYTAQAGYLKRTFAVNTDRRESMLLSVDPAEIARAVTNPANTPTDTKASGDAVQKTRMENAQRIWWWLLLTVFALALGETFLANRTYR